MTRKNQVRVGGIEVLPEWPQARVQGVALENAAAKKRVVPVSQNACLGILRKIAPQPSFLGRASFTAAHGLHIAIRVQHHDVPAAQVITVVAFAGRTRLLAPIPEVTGGLGIAILVIPQRGLRAVLELTPGLVIAVPKVLRAAFLLSQIPSSKDRAGNLLNQPGSGLGVLEVLAGGNVGRAHQREGRSGWLALAGLLGPFLRATRTRGEVGQYANRQRHGKSEARDGSNSKNLRDLRVLPNAETEHRSPSSVRRLSRGGRNLLSGARSITPGRDSPRNRKVNQETP